MTSSPDSCDSIHGLLRIDVLLNSHDSVRHHRDDLVPTAHRDERCAVSLADPDLGTELHVRGPSGVPRCDPRAAAHHAIRRVLLVPKRGGRRAVGVRIGNGASSVHDRYRSVQSGDRGSGRGLPNDHGGGEQRAARRLCVVQSRRDRCGADGDRIEDDGAAGAGGRARERQEDHHERVPEHHVLRILLRGGLLRRCRGELDRVDAVRGAHAAGRGQLDAGTQFVDDRSGRGRDHQSSRPALLPAGCAGRRVRQRHVGCSLLAAHPRGR